MTKPKKISKAAALKLIEENSGKVLSAVATKKNNTQRTYVFTPGNDSPEAKKMSRLGYLTVYDAVKEGYVNINTQTLSKLIVDNTMYIVK